MAGKNKQRNIGIGIVSIIMIILAAMVVFWKVLAAETAYSSGSMQIYLNGDNMAYASGPGNPYREENAIGTLTLSRSSAISIEDLRTKTSKWNVGIKVTNQNGSSVSKYNLRIGKYVNGKFTAVTQVSTGKDSNYGYYYIFNIPLTFTIPAHSRITGQSISKNCPDGRCIYYLDEAGTKKLAAADYVEEDTTVTVYLQVNAAQVGIKTYSGTRYAGATANINMERPSYQVTFRAPGNTNWGKEEIQRLIRRGEAVTKPEDPKKKGYIFQGWDQTDETLNSVKKALTVDALWEPEKVCYHFYGNGGSGQMPEFKLQYLESGRLPANQYTRKGYQFLGWSREKRGKIIYQDQELMHADQAENLKQDLYAIWKKKKSTFYITEVIEDQDMFTGDQKLVGGKKTKYSEHFTDSSYAHTDTEDDPGYFTEKE